MVDLDLVAERMRTAGAIDQLHRHWSSRAERAVQRLGYWIECAWPSLGDLYTEATSPLCDWLADRQRAFLRGWL